MCIHSTCAWLADCNMAGAAKTVLLKQDSEEWYTLLCKETNGAYKGKYSLPGGKRDPVDQDCWFNTLRRELIEEIKFEISDADFWNMFLTPSRKIRLFKMQRTVIFVGILPLEFDKDVLNERIKRDINNVELDTCLREVEDVDWFRIPNLIKKNGQYVDLPYFVRHSIKRIKPFL